MGSHANINDVDTLRKYIMHCEETNEYERIKAVFKKEKRIDDDDMLTTDGGPFNVFASIVSGRTSNPVDQSLLGRHADRFVLCHNRPISDEKWNDLSFDGGSMAGPDANGPGHVFITTKNLHVDYFNILPIVLKKDVQFLNDLLIAAMEYTRNRGWKNPGFYFHCYPLNSVNSLHLHVINKDRLGHMFQKKMCANLSMYDVLTVVRKRPDP